MPDADIEMTSKIIADSVYGCAGQRCLAASNIIAVGDHGGMIRDALVEVAKNKTTSGLNARTFRNRADAGNIGINIGVAAPMAQFPFSGWNDSFFGDLHGQGRHAIEFFTQTKVVIERWPSEWTRKF